MNEMKCDNTFTTIWQREQLVLSSYDFLNLDLNGSCVYLYLYWKHGIFAKYLSKREDFQFFYIKSLNSLSLKLRYTYSEVY